MERNGSISPLSNTEDSGPKKDQRLISEVGGNLENARGELENENIIPKESYQSPIKESELEVKAENDSSASSSI